MSFGNENQFIHLFKIKQFFTTNQKIYECATEKSLCLGPRQNIGDQGGLLEVPDLY